MGSLVDSDRLSLQQALRFDTHLLSLLGIFGTSSAQSEGIYPDDSEISLQKIKKKGRKRDKSKGGDEIDYRFEFVQHH